MSINDPVSYFFLTFHQASSPVQANVLFKGPFCLLIFYFLKFVLRATQIIYSTRCILQHLEFSIRYKVLVNKHDYVFNKERRGVSALLKLQKKATSATVNKEQIRWNNAYFFWFQISAITSLFSV